MQVKITPDPIQPTVLTEDELRRWVQQRTKELNEAGGYICDWNESVPAGIGAALSSRWVRDSPSQRDILRQLAAVATLLADRIAD